MPTEPMTLVERLRNPQWAHTPVMSEPSLDVDRTLADMREAADAGARLREKALEMRNAIDGIELALNGIDRFHAMAELWEDASADLPIKVAMTVGTMRQLRRAYDELNRIINSPEYDPANLEYARADYKAK